MFERQIKESPAVIARELSLLALDADNEGVEVLIDKYCNEAIEALPEEANVVRNGNVKVLNKLVGLVMKKSKGRADAQAVHARLKSILIPKWD